MIPSPAVTSKGNTTATSATIAASLPNDGTTFWFCSGFEITGGGATAGGVVSATLAGLLGGTLTYSFPVPTGVTVAAAPLVVEFAPALAAATASSDIVLTLPGLGAGNTGASIAIHGYRGARQLNA
jgi:hypothetical protein